MLHDGPSSDFSKPYSVIGIYGITGSGKTTLAQYVCDYEKGAGHFNLIMFIHVGKTFNVRDIFLEMLDLIKQQQPSVTGGPKSLKTELNDLSSIKAELEKELKGKCFLLVLDDLWVHGDNMKEPAFQNMKEPRILLDVLANGQNGSQILVTAQTKVAAARLLGAQEQIPIPDLEEDQYLSMFMHYAGVHRRDNNPDYGDYEAIGRTITKKLLGSPIAGRTVASRLQSNKSIDFWKRTEKLDVLNETMGALWWSYQQLGPDIRPCFAYCSTFPRGYVLPQDELVGVWIAQGFINNETEELEDVGRGYFDQLVTFSFLHVKKNIFGGIMGFTVHDLLHKLAERVSASEFFRIGLNDPPKDISPGVRHLFIETNNVAEILEKNLDFENLRTLFIKEAYAKPVDRRERFHQKKDTGEMIFSSKKRMKRNHELEKVLSCLFMRLRKLRVLIIKLNSAPQELLVPEYIDRMKHLCYLSINFRYNGLLDLSLPKTFSNLYHIQIIDIPSTFLMRSFPHDMSNLIYLRRISAPPPSPIGRYKSLQTLEEFSVKKKQGCELKQLMSLNKIEGILQIDGLGFVRSKEEALQANLTNKERLTILTLSFDKGDGDPHVQTEVLEGLCPPKNLQELYIQNYKGSRYPEWMLSRWYKDTPKQLLHTLALFKCSQLESIPKGSQLFSGLRMLSVASCDWESLPQNMECLVSLQTLELLCCSNIKLLPTLPLQSLKKIEIIDCKVLRETCREEGHTNWSKIQHIPEIKID